ncbi:MAG TPA: hypothetical protein VLC09_13575 [Polyangiaceae bacterium]|nr:hypothetical protein [Polyangiaceae bacterium]
MSNLDLVLASLEDLRVPLSVHANTYMAVPKLADTRSRRFKRLLEDLARDFSDKFSEVKEAHEFSAEQLAKLEVLSQKDYALLLGDHDDETFRSVGVPTPLGLRRLWLGFDDAGDLARPVDFSHKGTSYRFSLWKALYITYWFGGGPTKTRKLLAELAPEALCECFLRDRELDPDRKSTFWEPINECGRELLEKAVKTPSPELTAWARARAEGLLALPPEERGFLDTSILLAVLCAQLGKKELLPERYHPLFTLEPASMLSRSFGALVKKLPESVLFSAAREALSAFVDEQAMADPLRDIGGFWSLDPLWPHTKSNELFELAAGAAKSFFASHGPIAADQLSRSGTLDWLEARLMANPKLAHHAPAFASIRTEKGAPPPQIKQPEVLVDRNTVRDMPPIVVAQALTIARDMGVGQSLDEFWAWTEDQPIAWTRCAIVDPFERPVADVWLGCHKGDPIFGHVFRPATTSRLENVGRRSGQLVGVAPGGQELVRRLDYPARSVFSPEVIWDWAKYLATLGVPRAT